MPSPSLITGIFSDSDEFCAAAAGLNIEFSQLDCGKSNARQPKTQQINCVDDDALEAVGFLLRGE